MSQKVFPTPDNEPDNEPDDDERMAEWQESPEYSDFLKAMQDDLDYEKSQDLD